jgi:alpha-glucosidase
MLKATYTGLSQVFPGKRPFIIGRSTFPSSGLYAGHWGGDNTSKWYYMFFSIPQALSFSLFGIPMFGVDTCGFNGNSDEELCNRWMQLSAFFPFYRNHNTFSAIPQEAYVWASVIDATKVAMNIRFRLLPYMYTLFYLANTRGDTVMRALAWEFPNYLYLAAADRQFFLGPSILVTPVLEQGANTVDGVFPGNGGDECYYDWYTQSPVPGSMTGNVTIDAPLGHIPVYVRGGAILPTQPMALTTRDARKLPWSVLVALDKSGHASGYLYLDDGESVKPKAIKEVGFSVESGSSTLTASVSGDFEDANPLANVTIMGVTSAPEGHVRLNGQSVGSGVYDATSQTFRITGLEGATGGGAWAADWTLQW